MSNVMSAIGPKQTYASALQMSAFGGKADIIQEKRTSEISYVVDARPKHSV